INGSEVKYELGTLPPGGRRRITLLETRTGPATFPRRPYQLGLDDSVFVTCAGRLPHQFTVKDLGKAALHKPTVVIPEMSTIDLPTATKYAGQDIFCVVHADELAVA